MTLVPDGQLAVYDRQASGWNFPWATTKALAQDIADSQTVVLDDCVHVPQMEHTAPFNDALMKYLGQRRCQRVARRPLCLSACPHTLCHWQWSVS
jgi:hypothetical protein